MVPKRSLAAIRADAASIWRDLRLYQHWHCICRERDGESEELPRCRASWQECAAQGEVGGNTVSGRIMMCQAKPACQPWWRGVTQIIYCITFYTTSSLHLTTQNRTPAKWSDTRKTDFHPGARNTAMLQEQEVLETMVKTANTPHRAPPSKPRAGISDTATPRDVRGRNS